MVSLSNTHFPSKGIPPGRKGVDPVAINILVACIVAMELSEEVTKREEEPTESAEAPWT